MDRETTKFTPNDSLFLKDEHILFLVRKAEGLSKAIYLVTNLFDDKEPSKFRLRSIALSILESSSRIASLSIFEKDKASRAISLDITEAISLFELCRLSNLVSEMNFSILKKELISFVNALSSREKIDNIGRSFVIPQNLFSVPESNLSNSSNQVSVQPAPKITDNNVKTETISKGQSMPYKGQSITDSQSSVRPSLISDKNKLTKVAQPIRNLLPIKDKKLEKQTRKEIIMSLLRKNNNLMIKDFGAVIKDCSEKTIQRELSDLVSKGLLKREGDRRWSKYSIVSVQTQVTTI